MSDTAKIFINGRSQAVRLPAAYRFNTQEVFVRRDQDTGDVILSRRPATWDDFFAVLKDVKVPADFLTDADRDRRADERDPFDGWTK